MSELIKKELWDLINNSSDYNFNIDPLPVFHVLADYYVSNPFEHHLPNHWCETLEELRIITKSRLEASEEIFDKFKEILSSKIDGDDKLLAEIVEFFVEKYINGRSLINDGLRELILKKGGSDFFRENGLDEVLEILLEDNDSDTIPQDLVELIYWWGTDEDGINSDLAIYDSCAGLGAFARQHAHALNYQLACDLEWNKDKPEEIKWYTDGYKNYPWYVGIEKDYRKRLIASVRLLVNNPTNLEQMHISDGNGDNIDDYTGGWTFIAPYVIDPEKTSTDDFVKDTEKCVDKFIKAEGMSQAFFILPKSFCYDSKFYSIRHKIVHRHILSGVVEIPNNFYKQPIDTVVVRLCKLDYQLGSLFVDGRTFTELPNNDLSWLCREAKNTPHSIIKGDYTISQMGFCLLPSLYTGTIDAQDLQNEDIKQYVLKYNEHIEAETEAEKQRYAHQNASSDISHMLGTTFDRIGDAIYELEYIEGAKELSTILKDNFSYMRRFIASIGKDFSATGIKLKKECLSINDYFSAYCEGWKNYGKNTFDVHYKSSISDDSTFEIDDVFIKTLLDTLLDNAYRHGFDRFKSPDHQVEIATSYASFNNKPYVMVSVANNGKPFPENFSIEKYISRGEFSGDSGRTGLGGNHVYNITKRHGGFICLTSNDKWNVIVDILLPIYYYNDNDENKFIAYEHTNECM